MSLRFVTIFLLAVLLGGCASVDRTYGASPEIEVTTLTSLPEPRGDFIYRIGPQEALQIDIVGAELLSGKFLTDQFGRLQFPLLGEVDVGGKSPTEAATIIEQGLRGEYMVNPQVRIVPEEFPVPSISVGGEVEKPGTYPAAGRQTLLRAVNAAGGLSEFAKLEDVLVFRTVNGQDYVGLYNLEAIQRGNYNDPTLFPNDIVMVGDSPGRRWINTVLQLVPVATAASIVFERTTR